MELTMSMFPTKEDYWKARAELAEKRLAELRDMQHFNRLTPPEAERLALLVEEMGEAIQAAGKVLRHGYETHHPAGGVTNRYALEHECGHVRHAMVRLCDTGDLDKQRIHDSADAKARTVSRYLHHSA